MLNRKVMANYKLMPGYAETSTHRRPKEPTTVIVGQDEVNRARCVGSAYINGSCAWLAFKMPKQRRYYFQYRPW